MNFDFQKTQEEIQKLLDDIDNGKYEPSLTVFESNKGPNDILVKKVEHDNQIEIVCPICKKKMKQYTPFGVTITDDKCCAIVVAGDCDCGKQLTIKYPIILDKAFI